MSQHLIAFLNILLLASFILLGPNEAQSQDTSAENVDIKATFGSPNEFTTIELQFEIPLQGDLVKTLDNLAKENHFTWIVRPEEGAKVVMFKSEETFKGYGYHIYNIMKNNNIFLNKRSVETTFSK